MPQELFLVADHAGFQLKEELISLLSNEDIKIIDLSPNYVIDDDYPLVAKKLALSILANKNALGVAICGSGQGICMALNRFNGVRAGLADTQKDGKLIRQHNHAQVLCLSGQNYSLKKKFSIILNFLKAKPSQNIRHLRRVSELDNLTR